MQLSSMTGHGAGEAVLGAGVVRVELRAVNHRHLDVRTRVPSELADAGVVVEDVVRARCVRGRIEANVRVELGGQAVALDMEQARAAYRVLLDLRDELAPGEAVPVVALLRVPGVLNSSARFGADVANEAVRQATERAAADLAEMRIREGEALHRDLRSRIELLRGQVAWIATRRPDVVDGHRKRLHKRIEKLLEGTQVEFDLGRFVQEVALFADKSDVAEEITRLSSHLDQFVHLLGAGGESVGRKLDFLVQELGREVNTIGSKANDAAIAHRVVDMKAEIERVREQVQNVL